MSWLPFCFSPREPPHKSDRVVEFGTDLTLSVTTAEGSDDIITFSLPNSVFRVGFHVSDALVIEPRVAVDFVSLGGESFSSLQLGAALMYSLAESVFLVGEGGLHRVGADGGGNSEAASRGFFGGGIGFRNSLDDRLAFGGSLVQGGCPRTMTSGVRR